MALARCVLFLVDFQFFEQLAKVPTTFIIATGRYHMVCCAAHLSVKRR
ncbi:hypothetical protein ACLK19_21720 [Escherichia coli]